LDGELARGRRILDACVVDVNDLAVAERFGVAVSGLPLKYLG
jgi:hypothetical protein